ncbi:MAG: MFS transporter [Sphingomonadales bacterium]|nr:MAG: MFS transporter [Sphingomonadales bacterium]
MASSPNAATGDPARIETAPEPEKGLAYSYYVVVLLAVTYMLSFMDRTLISLLIAPIKAEFLLSDTQIGMLIGFGFVVFYSLLGLPFGALADRTDRRWLIVCGLVAWSLATSASGFVGGFAGLMAMRTLVGVGEATLSPAAYSTLADRFPPHRLGIAIAIYAAGVSVGGGLAMAFGGVLVEWAQHATMTIPLVGEIGGWRLALFAVGLLGFPLALLMVLTLREAPRKVRSAPPPLSELWRYIGNRKPAMIGVLTAFAFANVANYVVFLWAPALFMRVHGLDARTTGLIMGAIVGVFGSAGMVLGGLAVDWLTRRGVRDATVKVIFWCIVAQIPIMPVAFLVGSHTLAFALMVPTMMLTTAASSVQATALQLMTPARMRGRIIAIYLLVVTMVGMGLGPLMIGILSDNVFTAKTGLAPSMAVVALAGLVLATLTMLMTRGAAKAVIEEQAAA